MTKRGYIRNSEMSWPFSSVRGEMGIFFDFSIKRFIWPSRWRVLGPIEASGLILWLKVCEVFFPVNQDGFLPSLSDLLLPPTFHFL